MQIHSNSQKKYLPRPLPIDKRKRVIGLFKDELGAKIIIEFVRLRAK